MENQMLTKKVNTLCDQQLKIKIVNKFDEIINQVDIDAETILMRINLNVDIKQLIEDDMTKSRKLIIDQINKIKNMNLDNITEKSNPSEKPFEELLVKHCLYLDSDTVRSFTFNKDRLGILLVTDFYMSESQAELLNEMILPVLKIDTIVKDNEEEIFIDEYFLKNLVILEKLKTQLFSDQYIMTFSSKSFYGINELKLSGKTTNKSLKTEGLEVVSNVFSGLKVLDLENMNIDDLNEDASEHRNFYKIKKGRNFGLTGFQALRELELKDINLETLEPQSFHNLPLLEKLNISSNPLSELPDNIFSQLSNLKSLNLSYNLFRIIKKATLNGLHKLEHFCLRNINHKTIFEKNTFDELDNLKNVEITSWENSITRSNHAGKNNNRFKSEFKDFLEVDPPKNLEQARLDLRNACAFNFKNKKAFLNWLNLAKNIKKLYVRLHGEIFDESSFNNCHELEELIMTDIDLDLDKFPISLKKLKRIKMRYVKFLQDPENLFSNLESIEDVDIYHCVFLDLSHAHKLFQNLKNLKELSYKNSTSRGKNQNESKNQSRFVSINQLVKNNPNLVKLDLSFNRSDFLSLESNIESNHLETIDPNNKNIDYLSDKFNELVNLKQLYLFGNRIAGITNNIFSDGLKNLTELNLANNNLTTISNGMFSKLINLEKLNLDGNKINKIEKNSFEGLLNLKHLDMSCNELEQLDYELFKDLTNLTEMLLYKNQIINIDDLFNNNLKLKNLDLSHNQIRSVNFKILANLVNLECLELNNNQIEHIDINEINYFMCCAGKNVKMYLDNNLVLSSMKLQNYLGFVTFK